MINLSQANTTLILSNNEFPKQTNKKLERIEEILKSEELDSFFSIYSLTITEDKRIASGGKDGNISISSYDLNKKTWKRDIHKEKAHDYNVTSLCTLEGNRLLSSSDDCSIKIWKVFETKIELIKEINEHTRGVNRVIPLSKGRFASCSLIDTVVIWKNDTTYECLSTLKHNCSVSSILQLKGKEILVSCGYYSTPGLSFWNITKNNYTLQHNTEGYGVYRSTHMIELPDGNIALSSYDEPNPIIIFDISSY